ncbi:breast cancer metastasis-suppressor 1-like protein isoform X2 [Adelges cooleyi]|uniref:breast cancer metastasis-suppressor 1-like protein isoform X2 n=1 Tax=Adelges cooleyi TaxID=133065 RepID=UPI00217F28B0|nr:breast cancer metastasis-suppressor 1-like protein isoform X2 [Adelges cooleyi]
MSAIVSESTVNDINKIEESTVKVEESGSDEAVRTALLAVTDNIVSVQIEKKKNLEISASSSSSSCDSSSSESDSDNSSDLDEDENEKEQKRCDEKVREIENGFYHLKEMLYKERIREVEEKLVEVRLGTAKEYRVPLQELQDQMDSRLEVASVLKQFKLTNLKHKYEAEEQAIRQNFENNKEILYDTIKADLEEKIQRLEEARNEVDIDASLWLGRSLTRSGRGRGRRPYGHTQQKNKPVIVSGPYIVYMLKEHEILEDWTTIKKLISSSRRRENADQRYKPY